MSVDLKSGQLNWFDLETKCQRLVYDVIQPTIVKADSQHLDIKTIKQTIDENILKRLEECEFYLFSKTPANGRNPTMFDEIDRRIIQNQSDFRDGLC